MTAVPARPPAPARGLRLSWRRRLFYIAIAVVGVFVVATAALVAFDVYVHRKVQYEAGVNVWGYRGDVVGRKRTGERRIVALGGSTAFGTKTGDVLTWATSVVFGIFILLAVTLNLVLHYQLAHPPGAAAAPLYAVPAPTTAKS